MASTGDFFLVKYWNLRTHWSRWRNLLPDLTKQKGNLIALSIWAVQRPGVVAARSQWDSVSTVTRSLLSAIPSAKSASKLTYVSSATRHITMPSNQIAIYPDQDKMSLKGLYIMLFSGGNLEPIVNQTNPSGWKYFTGTNMCYKVYVVCNSSLWL